MTTALIALVALVLGWCLGWGHSIMFSRKNEEAMLDELVKQDVEIRVLKEALEKAHLAPLPAQAT